MKIRKTQGLCSMIYQSMGIGIEEYPEHVRRKWIKRVFYPHAPQENPPWRVIYYDHLAGFSLEWNIAISMYSYCVLDTQVFQDKIPRLLKSNSFYF